MQMWHTPRVTHPLDTADPIQHTAPRSPAAGSVADAPTVHVPSVPSARGADARPTRQTNADPKLAGIRELLVGPYLRDHERRLRGVERQAAELAARPASGVPVREHSREWREQVEAALGSLQRAREEHDQAHAFAVAQLNTQVMRERDERADEQRAMNLLASELRQLRLEMERERQEREDQVQRHAQSIAAIAAQLDHEREAHVRLHAHQSTELDARLERERQHLAAELQQSRSAPVETQALRDLLAEAQRALVAMRDERQYLAGLLAELGLHLVRHAGSPAARADESTQRFLGASGGER